MSELTLFEAYVLACEHMRHCRSQRGNSYGIAVDNDQLALNYQKHSRQAGKFYATLKSRLQSIRTVNKTLETTQGDGQ